MNARTFSALLASGLLVPVAVHAAGPNKLECIAANDAAQELRRAGKLHLAREKLLLCDAATCPALVREDCAQRLTEVDGVMPSLIFEAKDGAGKAIVAVTVTMDGQRLTDRLDGQSLLVDPGEHRFAFESAGMLRAEQTIDVREGERGRREMVVFRGPADATPAASVPSSPGLQRTVALALGGAGIVGLVVGGVLGLASKSTYSHALQTECGNNPNGCSPQGIHDGQSAHGQAAASTAMFVVGGVLLGAGAVLWVTAARVPVGVGATVGSDRAGLIVAGGW